MIAWKEDYEVGIDVVDSQHKELFVIAGKAFDLLKNEFVTDKYDAMVEILEELKDYAAFHFETEEKYLEEIGFKKLFSHKMEHAAFLQEIEAIDLEELDENQEEHMMRILQFIVNWIDRHILEKDQQFAVK
jgi:hemerythrin